MCVRKLCACVIECMYDVDELRAAATVTMNDLESQAKKKNVCEHAPQAERRDVRTESVNCASPEVNACG